MRYAIEAETDNLIEDITQNKRIAQQMGVLIKLGKFRRFIETAVSMRGERVSSYFSIYNDSLWIHIGVNHLEGMKDERLAGILATLEYMNPDNVLGTEDYAAGLERTFKYEWYFEEEDKPTIKIRVYVAAHIKPDSTTCRREVTGYTKDEPRPIYKLVCEDEVPAAAVNGHTNEE